MTLLENELLNIEKDFNEIENILNMEGYEFSYANVNHPINIKEGYFIFEQLFDDEDVKKLDFIVKNGYYIITKITEL